MDRFQHHADSLTGPAAEGAAVTPHATDTLPNTARALWVGTGGTLDVVLARGARVTLQGVPNGTLLPLRVQAVRAAGTTATGLVALW